MLDLLETVKKDYSTLKFKPSKQFVWQPSSNTIRYNPESMLDQRGTWSLLHELGHATLEHQTYNDDLTLLMMEVEAWSKAKELAAKYEVTIDEVHIQKCIDSYRIWLHKRSRCIDCKTNSLQDDASTYLCHNCGARWEVTNGMLGSSIKKSRIAKV